jgi:putative membrane protein
VVVSGSFRPAFAAAVAVAAVAVLAVPGLAFADPGPGGIDVPDTTLGAGKSAPLSASDRDFVARVRLAGLWEMPAGAMAMQKGISPRVREIGRIIAEQHIQLDQLDRAAASQLGMSVPNRPLPEQQGWLDEMAKAHGADFDRVFVLRLRAAHGAIFPAIASVRSDTRNDVVRKLAQEANQFVMTHMTLLESTDLVDYNGLPVPPDPPPLHLHPLAAVQPRSSAGGASSTVIWVVLGAGALAAGTALIRIVRPH